MRRCGGKEFHDSLLKRLGFFMLVISDGVIFHIRIALGKNEKTVAFTYCPLVRERVSRPGVGGWWRDLNSVI